MERRRDKGQQQRGKKGKGRGRIGEFLQSAGRLFKYSRKPKGKEYSLFLKLVGIAILVAGGIAFVIHLIATLLTEFLG